MIRFVLVEIINYWPLVVVLEDVYVPEFAEGVLRLVRQVDNSTLVAAITTNSYLAWLDTEKRRN